MFGNPWESQELGYVPPDGNQFTNPAKMNIRSVPVKNTGRPSVARDVVVAKVSTPDPRRLDTSTPTSIPITSAISVEVPSSRRVFVSFPVLIIS